MLNEDMVGKGKAAFKEKREEGVKFRIGGEKGRKGRARVDVDVTDQITKSSIYRRQPQFPARGLWHLLAATEEMHGWARVGQGELR